jgi:hypothetical protein
MKNQEQPLSLLKRSENSTPPLEFSGREREGRGEIGRRRDESEVD